MKYDSNDPGLEYLLETKIIVRHTVLRHRHEFLYVNEHAIVVIRPYGHTGH